MILKILLYNLSKLERFHFGSDIYNTFGNSKTEIEPYRLKYSLNYNFQPLKFTRQLLIYYDIRVSNYEFEISNIVSRLSTLNFT